MMGSRSMTWFLSTLGIALLEISYVSSQALRDANSIYLDTSSQTYVLFLDMREVESLENVEHVVNMAVKHPNNPVLPLGDIHEWDSLQARPWSGSLIYDKDENIFKCWYIGTDHAIDLSHVKTGYAVSHDGVFWSKPRVGLFEYRGSKDNNLVNESNDTHVVKDYAEKDPAKRYKMLSKKKGSVGNRGPRFFPFYSSDGLRWIPGPEVQVAADVEISQLIMDPQEKDPQKRFKIYGQDLLPTRKSGLDVARKIIMGFGPDLEHISLSAANPVLDPDDGVEEENHFAKVLVYKSYYILLYDYGRYLDYYGHGKWGNFTGDVRLAVSRDGEHFRRVNPHQPVIARGNRNDWDGGFLVISSAIEYQEKFYIYYSGMSENWSSWPAANRIVGTGRSMAGYMYPAQMGLAVMRRDGFTCLQARDGYGPGVVTTIPVHVKNAGRSKLCINASELMAFRDWIEVEIVDSKTGIPIHGYGKKECNDIASDGTSIVVSWRETGATLGSVVGSEVKLRFYLYGKAKLYSFTFKD